MSEVGAGGPETAPTSTATIDPTRGLTAAEVADRRTRGLTNDIPAAPSRTFGQIVRANVFTRFNALMTALAVLVIVAGSYRDVLFYGVVVANVFIGVIQEFRAKRTLDQLTLLNAPKARVVRDSNVAELPVNELVLDDVLELSSGQQVVADAVVLSANECEVDESLLTGESDAMHKEPGDPLMSGSFVVAGRARAGIDKVGADSYAARLAEEARRFTLVRSELMAAVNQIIRVVTWVLVPTATLLFISQLRSHDSSGWREAVVGAVAGVVGMVPEGLVLLTSVAFAVGVLRLARRRCLVQEMPAIEVLARVDVLCLDKTGTITEGSLELHGVEPIGDAADLDVALAAFATSDPDPNPTQRALVAAYPHGPGWTMTGRVPFSSARKWSAAAFDGHGAFVLGAPELVLPDRYDLVRDAVERHAQEGERVLLLAASPAPLAGDELPADLQPAALVLLADRIRPEAPATLEYFRQQGVTLKVISGDNPVTVAAVAKRAGMGDTSYVDATTLPDDGDALADALERTSVFGRVRPHQKQAMVKAMQERGHVVAMTGDGVNDVLALKSSDCGVAMASGSEATRAVAQLVLLDSNFAVMPAVVAEGRRVINNIQRVASLFLVKTMYSTLLALLTGVLTFPYPFRPVNLTLISAVSIGIPSFFLALAPNDERVRAGFLRRIAAVAIPGGTVIAVATMVAYGVSRLDDSLTLEQQRTTAVIVAGGIALVVLARVASPLNPLRIALVASMVGLFALALVTPPGQKIFVLDLPGWREVAVALGLVAVSWPALEIGARLTDRIGEWWGQRRARRHPRPAASGAPGSGSAVPPTAA